MYNNTNKYEIVVSVQGLVEEEKVSGVKNLKMNSGLILDMIARIP